MILLATLIATALGLALGAHPETFMGLSGLGDLVLTATGDLSRNRQVAMAADAHYAYLADRAAGQEGAHAPGGPVDGAQVAMDILRNRATERGLKINTVDITMRVLPYATKNGIKVDAASFPL